MRKSAHNPALFRRLAGARPARGRRKTQGKAMVSKALDDDSNHDVTEKIREALGSGKVDGCRVWRQDQKTGDREYLGRRDVINDDYDLLIRGLQQDYPKGGKFILSFVDLNNKVVTNDSVVLAALPDAQQPRTERAPAAAPAQGMDPYLQMFFQQQERQAQESRETNRMIITGVIGIATAIAPTLFRRQEKGESAIELLNAVLDAKQKITPPDEADAFDKTLDRMAKMKALMPESSAGEGEGGLMGLAKSFAPALIQLATTQAAQGAPGLAGPQPQQQIAAPAAAAPAQPQASPYDVMMSGIKTLLARQQPPNVIANYLDMQIRLGTLSETDVTTLLDQLAANPGVFLPTLAMYGIQSTAHAIAIATALAMINGVTNGDELQSRWAAYGIAPGAEHAGLVAACIGYFADDLDDDAETVGMGGNGADIAMDGARGGGGIDHAGSQAPGH